MDVVSIFEKAVRENASDVMIVAGLPVSYKISGEIQREPGDRFTADDTETLVKSIYHLAGDRPMDELLKTGDDDFSFSLPGLSRFRVNTMKQRGSLAAVVRTVTFSLPDRHVLGIPDRVMGFVEASKGLVLVTGPAGSGKSTTLACMIDLINRTRSAHIITIEDPIEFLHRHDKSIVTQRELGGDTRTYETALRAALRQAPDVIMVGEMRDTETIKAAITAAETGHLVLSTLHTIGAANTVDRIVDSFPPAQQQQVRVQLAMSLQGVVSQQLVPSLGKGVSPAFEIMVANSAIRNLIRESKSHQLESVIFSNAAAGMITMDTSLYNLAFARKISVENAIHYSSNGEQMQKRLQMAGMF